MFECVHAYVAIMTEKAIIYGMLEFMLDKWKT